MKLRPSESLTDAEVESGLKFIVKEGLAAEAMATFTGGTFLVALALTMGASNVQIGLLAALPILTNVFQLISIWLVQKYKNRRMVSVVCSFFARVPLFIIAFLPFMFTASTSLFIMILMLSLQYFFAAIAGASWHSWVKDLVPETRLGSYFSNRGRLIQILNVSLSLGIALIIDYVKSNYPALEIKAYSIMFVVGGALGMLGVYLLSRAPEPKTVLEEQDLMKLLGKPLKDKNFRRLLQFQSFYAFATNLALPFFVVYMMKTVGLSFSYIIGLGLLAKLGSIISIKFWGTYSDRYSNKTIIRICAPTFVLCLLSWSFTSMYSNQVFNILLLALIHLVSGISAAGVDLAINNIGVKLAPKKEAIAYISARNIVVAIFAAIAPIIGGMMADFFATHHLSWTIEWQGPQGITKIPLLDLKNWTFFFVIGAILTALSLRLLKYVKEEGEVEKDKVVIYMKKRMTREIRKNISTEAFVYRINNPVILPAIKKQIMKYALRQ